MTSRDTGKRFVQQYAFGAQKGYVGSARSALAYLIAGGYGVVVVPHAGVEDIGVLRHLKVLGHHNVTRHAYQLVPGFSRVDVSSVDALVGCRPGNLATVGHACQQHVGGGAWCIMAKPYAEGCSQTITG